jgi:general secretion pathway protein J
MNHSKGFTLAEMVIAIAIFAIISTISYASLARFLEESDYLTQRREAFKAMQNAFAIFGRDIRFLVKRPVRDGYGEEEPMLVGQISSPLVPGELLRLTISQPLPAMPGQQQLTRVAWRFANNELSRAYWSVLDRSVDSQEIQRVTLRDVASVEIRYYNADDSGKLQPAEEWSEQGSLPHGIELVITGNNGDEFRRLFEVPHAG